MTDELQERGPVADCDKYLSGFCFTGLEVKR